MGDDKPALLRLWREKRGRFETRELAQVLAIVPTHGNSPVVILDAGPDAARAVRDSSLLLRLGQCLFYEPTNSLGPRRKIGFPPPKIIQLGEQIFMKPHMNWRSHAGRRSPTLIFG